MQPWNNWFHCIGTTHGSWLRGDPRGWRAKHHREHVEGDYRNPPPPVAYAPLLRESLRLMKRPEVVLNFSTRRWACDAMVEAITTTSRRSSSR